MSLSSDFDNGTVLTRDKLLIINKAINVKDVGFAGGAVGDGVTDDTAAIAAALSLGSAQGRPVYLPAGAYAVTASLVYTDGMFIFGDSPSQTEILYTGSGYCFVQSTPGVRIFDVKMEAFKITLNNGTPLGGIDLNSVSLGRFDQLVIAGQSISQGIGFNINGPTGGFAVYNLFTQCTMLSMLKGFYVAPDGSNDTRIISCRATLCGNGVHVLDSNHVLVSYSALEGCTIGVNIEASSPAFSDGCDISHNRFEGNANAITIPNTNVRLTKITSNVGIISTDLITDSGLWTILAFNTGELVIKPLHISTPVVDEPFVLERTGNTGAGGEASLLVHDSNVGGGDPTQFEARTDRISGKAFTYVNQSLGELFRVDGLGKVYPQGLVGWIGQRAGTPEGAVTASVGAMVINTDNGLWYRKRRGAASAVGWESDLETAKTANTNFSVVEFYDGDVAAANLRWLLQSASSDNLNWLRFHGTTGAFIDTPFTLNSSDGLVEVPNGIRYGAAALPRDLAGSGDPETVITAPIGSTWRRTDGTPNNTFYVKESGTGNTGWNAV